MKTLTTEKEQFESDIAKSLEIQTTIDAKSKEQSNLANQLTKLEPPIVATTKNTGEGTYVNLQGEKTYENIEDSIVGKTNIYNKVAPIKVANVYGDNDAKHTVAERLVHRNNESVYNVAHSPQVPNNIYSGITFNKQTYITAEEATPNKNKEGEYMELAPTQIRPTQVYPIYAEVNKNRHKKTTATASSVASSLQNVKKTYGMSYQQAENTGR